MDIANPTIKLQRKVGGGRSRNIVMVLTLFPNVVKMSMFPLN